MRRLVEELKRRNVFRVALAYLAVGWLLLQVAGLVFDAFELPRLAMRVLLAVLLLGLLPALVFSWVFEITPEGLVRDDGSGGEPVTPRLTDRKLKIILISALAGIAVILVANQFRQPRALPGEAAKAPSSATPTRSSNAARAPSAASIAVLPFADMSQAKDQEYFSDGMAEELLNLLAQIPGLRVAGRTSSFSFKGKRAGIAEIGKALNVATVLEGSVRKSGDRLRITAQLINADNGYHMWSQTYDRKLTDVFALQDEIAGAVVEALKLKLLPAQRPSKSKHHAPGPAAYDKFLLGRMFAKRGTREGYASAITAYRQAVALEPAYAAAHAELSLAEQSTYWLGGTPAFAEGRRRALDAAEQAIAQDPALADGYAARSMIRMDSWDWSGSQVDLDKALALNTDSVTTQACHACLLATQGRIPEAITAIRKAIELDPLSAQDWTKLGYFETSARNYVAAREAFNRALVIAPENNNALFNLAQLALLEGRLEMARALIARTPDGPRRLGLVAMVEHSLGNTGKSQKALDTLVARHASGWAYRIAMVHAWRGETDHAFAWLERAYGQHELGLLNLKWDALLRTLRSDPRYSALLKKMGLPE